MNKILLTLFLISTVNICLSAQSEAENSKFEFGLSFGMGSNIIKSDESLNLRSVSVFSGRDSNIGFSNPGFIAQLGVEVRKNIGHGFYWGGNGSIIYSNITIDRIIQWIYVPDGFFNTYNDQNHITLKAQYINGVIPLYFGKYLNKKRTLTLELGVLNQFRILDRSKLKIIKTKFKDNSGISTPFPFPISSSISTFFSEENTKIQDKSYQWGFLSKARFQCFQLNNQPVFVGISYIYYPKSIDFWKGHQLNGTVLLSISTNL